MKKQVWRLRKTLSRHIEIRPIEDADIRYSWAGYKAGRLAPMGFAEGLKADQFKPAFEAFVLSHTHAAWTIIAETKMGLRPIGFAMGAWAPQEAFMIITGIVWFPWASKRNIIEGTVAFFNRLNKQMGWMGFAATEHKPVYEVCMKHGIMRRIGTSELSGQRVAVYEARN